MVVIHVAADSLSRKRILAASADPTEDVPAGTLPTAQAADPTCHIDGVGAIEPETARRLACDSTLLGAIVDEHGCAAWCRGRCGDH